MAASADSGDAAPAEESPKVDSIIGLDEAAAILNLPRTLLNDFVSYEFNGKKLAIVDRRRRTFRRDEVESYLAHLDSTWPEETRAPPEFVTRYLDVEAEASGGCASCHRGAEIYEYAHIEPWAKSRCHSPHNLVRLCPTCHRGHGGDIKRLRMIKDLARGRLQGVVIAGERRRRARLAWVIAVLIALLVVALTAWALWANISLLRQRQTEIERRLERNDDGGAAALTSRGEAMRSKGRTNEAAVYFVHALAKTELRETRALLAQLSLVSVENVVIPASPKALFAGGEMTVDVLASSTRDRATWFRINASAPGNASVTRVRELGRLWTYSGVRVGVTRGGVVAVLYDAERRDPPNSAARPFEIVRRFSQESGQLLDEYALPSDVNLGLAPYALDADADHDLVFVRSLPGLRRARIIRVPASGPCSVALVEGILASPPLLGLASPVVWTGKTLRLGTDDGLAFVEDPFGVEPHVKHLGLSFPTGPSPVVALSQTVDATLVLCQNGSIARVTPTGTTTHETGLKNFEATGVFDVGEYVLIGGGEQAFLLRKGSLDCECLIPVGVGCLSRVGSRFAVIGATQWIEKDNSVNILDFRRAAALEGTVSSIEKFTGLALEGLEVVAQHPTRLVRPVADGGQRGEDPLLLLEAVETAAESADWKSAQSAYERLRETYSSSPSVLVGAVKLSAAMEARANALAGEGKKEEAERLRSTIHALIGR